MGLKTTFKKFFDLDDDFDEVIKDAFGWENEEDGSRRRQGASGKPGRKPYVERQSRRSESNIVTLHAVKEPPAKTEVMLIEPRHFDDVQTIADHLRNKRSVVFNLQRASIVDARRMIDFISGAVYALDGHIQKLGPDTFLCAPAYVDINGVISGVMEKRL